MPCVAHSKTAAAAACDARLIAALFCAGLPFPAAHDPHVRLQRLTLDEEARAGAAGITGGRSLSGEQWCASCSLSLSLSNPKT